MEKLILIDGSGLIYRGFYAIPPFLKSPSGVQTNAVFGFTNILLSLIAREKPDYIAVAFDKKGPTFRHKEYAEYKATRVKAPQELYNQIPLVKQVVESFGIPSFEADGFEADDILATVTQNMAKRKNLEIEVATGDFDLFQMVRPQVKILYPGKGFKEATTLNENQIKEKYGLTPAQIPDYKGLAGDTSDNIPGVHGIGEKTALNLLAKYKNLEGVYEHLTETSASVRKKLEDGKEDAFKSRELTRLREDVPIKFYLEDCRVKSFDPKSARKTFEELGFKSLVKRLDEIYGTKTTQGTLF